MEGNDLSVTVDALFNQQDMGFTTREGLAVRIRPAKMKHLNQMLELMGAALGRLPDSQIVSMIDVIAARQIDAIANGQSAGSIDLKAVMQEIAGKGNIVVQMMQFVVDLLPKFAATFSNLTEEQYGELEFHEGSLLLTGIVAVNYGFFIQSWPLISGVLTKRLAGVNFGHQDLLGGLLARVGAGSVAPVQTEVNDATA